MSAQVQFRPCPICKAKVSRARRESWYPFCSDRCKTIDLGRWLTGSYAVDMLTGELEEVEDTDDLD